MFQEFKNKQYVTLENTILDSIEIRLLDENNTQLQLLPDVPTFLQLKIRKMSRYDDSTNIHLSSKPKEGCKDNTPYKFKIQLPQDIYINQSYKIALTSINYPCNLLLILLMNLV